VFSTDGKVWEHTRAMLRPQFARSQVSDLNLEEDHTQNLLKALPVGQDGWVGETDLLPLFFRLTMDSASEFLFGESVNSQLSALPNQSDKAMIKEADMEFVRAFEQSQDHIAFSFRLNDWYALGQSKEFFKLCDICHKYIDPFVQKAINLRKEGFKRNEKDHYTFLEGLAEETQDPIEIRDQLLSILVAGRDTTASLLSFLFLKLAENPTIFSKLRNTIINDFGTFEDTSRISFSSLKACGYLQWCLNEALRLYPTVPLNSRRSVVDTTIPRGGGPDGMSPLFVPKGMEVNYSVYAMHRQPSIWGPDCEEYKPERWEGRKAGFEYLPFNGGPR
jgi:cytochrome P450